MQETINATSVEEMNQETQMDVADKPLVPAENNVVATQNVGLMENDPFQEKSTDEEVAQDASSVPTPPSFDEVFSGAPAQNATGAQVEPPVPIIEQQIALNVNVDDVFGQTKEDEITKIVTQTVNNNGVKLSDIAPQVNVEPTPEVTAEPTPQPTPIMDIEPGPIIPIPEENENKEATIAPSINLEQKEEPIITLEPGPIAPSNPFDGITPEEQSPNANIVPTPDFQSATSAPVPASETPVEEQKQESPVSNIEPGPLTIEPGPIENPIAPIVEVTPVVEQTIDNNNQNLTDLPPLPETPTVETPEPTTPEISSSPEVTETNPITEPIDSTPEPEVTEPSMVAAQTVAPPAATMPTPVAAPVVKDEPIVKEEPKVTNESEEEMKTVIVQATPLGKVQPVAPIKVITEPVVKEESKVEPQPEPEPEPQPEPEPISSPEVEEIKVEEHIEEVQEIKEEAEETPIVEEITTESPTTELQSSSLEDNDYDYNEDEKTEVEEPKVEEHTGPKVINRKKINVEKDLYIDLEAEETQTHSRNSKRKIVRGKEKFKSNQKIVPMEEEPIVKFCSACGNVVSNDDVLCPKCAEPIE